MSDKIRYDKMREDILSKIEEAIEQNEPVDVLNWIQVLEQIKIQKG